MVWPEDADIVARRVDFELFERRALASLHARHAD
jgi:hypothetical protein